MSKVIKFIGSILSILCLGAIVFLSLKRSVSIPGFVVGADKGAHLIAYTALSFLFFISFCYPVRRRFFKRNILAFLSAAMLSFVVGYAIELCQPAFGRAFELYDLFADGIGSVSGSLLGFFCVFFICLIERRSHRV